MRVGRKSLAGLAVGICLLLGLAIAGSRVGSQAAGDSGSGYTTLADDQMSHLVGGDSCKGCRYDGRRLDECYHASLLDSCRTDTCIANYEIESTCDPGTGTCTAFLVHDQPHRVQYRRVDSGCTTNQPTGWVVWFNHYYGSSCIKYTANTRCQKINGTCDGTLIDSSSKTPQIQCPQ